MTDPRLRSDLYESGALVYGEQKAKMLKSAVMARRPDYKEQQEEILSREELKTLRQQLAHLSVGHVRDFYERAYYRSRITTSKFPSARAIQELVQAWKLLRQWRKGS